MAYSFLKHICANKRIYILFSVACPLFFISFIIFWFFFRPNFAWSIHKEVVYANIIKHVVNANDTDAEKVTKVFNFVRNHEYVFPG